MRKATLVTGALAFVAIVCSAMPARAQVFQPNQPKILLHVMAPTTKGACTTWPENSLAGSCTNAVTSGLSNPDGSASYFLYVIVAKGDSILNLAGFQLGVDYDLASEGYPHNSSSDTDGVGIDMFGWNLCATLQFALGDWTNQGAEPGGGNLITWDRDNVCQVGPVAIAGYFYIAAYGPSTMYVTPRPVDGTAKVADCNAFEYAPLPLTALGFAAFSPAGTVDGCNPCDQACEVVATVPTTWSSIKTLGR